MRILVCYGTTEGQTRKIAGFVGDVLREHGHDVLPADAASDDKLDLRACDAAILLGSVHMGHYQSSLIHHITAWREALNAMPSAFISVSLSAAGDDPDDLAGLDRIFEDMRNKTGWNPDMVLQAAGAFRFTQYDFFKRWTMRLIARQKGANVDPNKDTEYTDWDAVTQFVEAFLAKTPAEAAA